MKYKYRHIGFGRLEIWFPSLEEGYSKGTFTCGCKWLTIFHIDFIWSHKDCKCGECDKWNCICEV